jgi:uncharacterized membrane protein
MSAISVLLGLTNWGFIPWFSSASLTIMHVPVIIGAVLEGPIVGTAIGLIFGVFSLIQANVPPVMPSDPLFVNPLISVLPRLFIGVTTWLAWRALQKRPRGGLIAGGVVGVAAHVLLVVGGIQGWPNAILIALGVLGGLIDVFLVLNALEQSQATALIAAGVVGSLTNTVLVLGMIGLLGKLAWGAIYPIAIANGLPEATASAIITLAVVAPWRRIEIGGRKGASI